MNLTPVKSSNIEGVHYDEVTRTLTVKFRSGGQYAYGGVAKEHYDGLISAESPGGYLNKNIRRGDYKFVKK